MFQDYGLAASISIEDFESAALQMAIELAQNWPLRDEKWVHGVMERYCVDPYISSFTLLTYGHADQVRRQFRGLKNATFCVRPTSTIQ